MFRREERRREVVEVTAVGEVAHKAGEEQAEQAQIAEQQAPQASAAAAPPPAAEAPSSGPAVTPSADLTDAQVSELERLAKLKEEGVLSDEEFAAEKAKILGL